MSWYRIGTVSVTNGSPNVVGAGTNWFSVLNQGDAFLGPDGKLYEVLNVSADGALALSSNYTGTTLSGQSYAVFPTQSIVRDLVQQVTALLTNFNVPALTTATTPVGNTDRLLLNQAGASRALLFTDLVAQVLYVRGCDTTGATSSTAVINAAINEVFAAGGGTVRLPPGILRCNIENKPGVMVLGQGKGANASITGVIPMLPNYTFTAGGTTLIPDNRALPVYKASGTGGASTWAEGTLGHVKISDNAGAIVAGTVGILIELANETHLPGVEVRNMAIGIQHSSAGKTAWGLLMSGVTVSECGDGIRFPDLSQNSTPITLLGVDVRRCTGTGVYARDVSSFSWHGGTLADNEIGLEVYGGTFSGPVLIESVEFETNIHRAAIVGMAGEAMTGAVTFKSCGFRDYRGSAGNGSVYPSTFAGSVAIEFNASSERTELVLDGSTFTTFETIIQRTGFGRVVKMGGTKAFQCGSWGVTFGSFDIGAYDIGVADTSGAWGLSPNRFTFRSNDFTTWGNNLLLQAANTNGATLVGMAPHGTGSFCQLALYGGSDVNNESAVVLEAADTYNALVSTRRGTGTTRELRIGLDTTFLIRMGPGNSLGFFGNGPVNRPTGVAVSAAGIHAALVSLGLITA